MALITIDYELTQIGDALSASTTPAIASGDMIVVEANGSVISSGSSAISGSDLLALDVSNDGLISGTSQTIYLDGPGGQYTLTNGSTGRIENDGGSFYAAHIKGASSSVANAGQMVGSSNSPYPTLIQTSATSSLVNSGLITDSAAGAKTYAAAVAFYGVSTADFVNTGTIHGDGTGGTDADATIGFIASTFNVSVDNAGLITGPQFALLSDAQTSEEVENSGTIVGDVKLSDIVGGTLVNAGTIVGDVFLRGGDDSYTAVGEGGVDGEVDGGRGDDALTGAGAADLLRGREGRDVLRGLGGDDMLYGGDAADSIHGGGGADSAWGGAWGDLIDGGDGADTLRGEGGADQLWGGRGQDAIYAGIGADTAGGGGGADLVYGGDGHDSLRGGAGYDTLVGGAGRDTIVGNKGNDRIDGAGWADALYGGGGDDTLDGGAGADTLTGGDGADTFVFSAFGHSGLGSASDRILDMDRGEDLIDLSALDVTWNGTAAFDGSAGFARYYVAFGNAQIMIDQDGDMTADARIVVEGVTNLSGSDFIL